MDFSSSSSVGKYNPSKAFPPSWLGPEYWSAAEQSAANCRSEHQSCNTNNNRILRWPQSCFHTHTSSGPDFQTFSSIWTKITNLKTPHRRTKEVFFRSNQTRFSACENIILDNNSKLLWLTSEPSLVLVTDTLGPWRTRSHKLTWWRKRLCRSSLRNDSFHMI